MNTTLSRAPERHDHPPISHHDNSGQAHEVRRVSLLDQAALHLGVALIKWGRRPLSVESRERRATRIEQHLARLERERLAERAMRLGLPVR